MRGLFFLETIFLPKNSLLLVYHIFKYFYVIRVTPDARLVFYISIVFFELRLGYA